MNKLKQYALLLFGLSVFLQVWADTITMQTCEYWLDGKYEAKNTISFFGEWEAELDMSDLCEGVHTISMRFSDSKNRWSSPITRYFIVSGARYPDTTLKGYRYWIDNDYGNGINGEFAESGIVQLDLDMSTLCEGVHTLSVQTEDSYGRKSSPITRYFIVPGVEYADNKISAYEYWFNRGDRVRVEIDPENPFELKEKVIEIVDVIPNKIPDDYRFDVATKTAWCNDDVYFGMQIFDLLGNATPAIMSDTFAMEVPVKVNFMQLSSGVEENFEVPQLGFIKGFCMNAEVGDSIEWEISPECTLDLFSENGEKITYKNQFFDNGNKWCRIKTETSVTYALVHSANPLINDMSVKCTQIKSSGLADIEDDDNVKIFVNNGSLIVESTKEIPIKIVNTTGIVMVYETKVVGTNSYPLSSGVYIIQAGNKVVKVIL